MGGRKWTQPFDLADVNRALRSAELNALRRAYNIIDGLFI